MRVPHLRKGTPGAGADGVLSLRACLLDEIPQPKIGQGEPLDDLSFYEEGGVSGLIHGETVLFGTAAFCRKMHVTMPGGLSLKTGAFLAVDGTLIATVNIATGVANDSTGAHSNFSATEEQGAAGW